MKPRHPGVMTLVLDEELAYELSGFIGDLHKPKY